MPIPCDRPRMRDVPSVLEISRQLSGKSTALVHIVLLLYNKRQKTKPEEWPAHFFTASGLLSQVHLMLLSLLYIIIQHLLLPSRPSVVASPPPTSARWLSDSPAEAHRHRRRRRQCRSKTVPARATTASPDQAPASKKTKTKTHHHPRRHDKKKTSTTAIVKAIKP